MSRRIHACGWVANHDGNVSARTVPGRIVCTPTAMSKSAVDEGTLVVVDDLGQVVAGRFRPPSEIGLHLAAYRARPDVRAVLHAHPPHATALAAAGRDVPYKLVPFIAEAVVSLGAAIPVVPFAMPGPDAARALAPFLGEHDALLLEAHGVLTLGDDPEQALLRMELVEHLARILLLALPAGGPRALGPAEIAKLLEARARYRSP